MKNKIIQSVLVFPLSSLLLVVSGFTAVRLLQRDVIGWKIPLGNLIGFLLVGHDLRQTVIH